MCFLSFFATMSDLINSAQKLTEEYRMCRSKSLNMVHLAVSEGLIYSFLKLGAYSPYVVEASF